MEPRLVDAFYRHTFGTGPWARGDNADLDWRVSAMAGAAAELEVEEAYGAALAAGWEALPWEFLPPG